MQQHRFNSLPAPCRTLTKASRFGAALLLGLSLLSAVRAQDPAPLPIVSYNPTFVAVQGQLPVTRTFDVAVTSPYNLSELSMQPTLVTFSVALTSPASVPAGADPVGALGYVTFSNPSTGTLITSLTYTASNQTQTIRVNVNLPANAIAGDYGYKVRMLGWPVNASYGLRNEGFEINASVTAPPPLPTPPVVVIGTPADGSVINVSATSFPLSVPFTFTANANGQVPGPISAASADLDGTTIALTSLNGLATTSVSGAGTLSIAAPGQHTVTARATNAAGTATDTNTFTVKVSAPPPTVVINTPTPGTSYTYRAGGPAAIVPFTFTAKSNFGGIRTLAAKVDGANVPFTPVGIGSLTATGTISLSYTTAGTHTLEVTTTDDNGTATTQSNFIVTVVAPTPTIAITQPSNQATFTLPAGATTMSIPFTFNTSSNNGFVVDSVSAAFDNHPQAITSTTGLGTAAAVSKGTLTGVTAGTHTLTATGVSAGISVTASVTFTVKSSAVPPSVVINTPAPGATFTRVSCGPALSIPLTFTGRSNTPGAVITRLTASLNGTPLSVATSNLNTPVANGSATMSVCNAGTYTIAVSAVDVHGTASATRTFAVTVVQGRTICGEVFFDIDFDGREDCGEFGLGGVTMKLVNSANQVVDTDVTNSCGQYAFTNIGPGTYTVVAVAATGLSATTPSPLTVTVAGSNVRASDTGFGLNFNAIRGMTANGYTIGYWKNNIDKALAGKTSGTQVSKYTLECYTHRIGDFGLSTFDNITMKGASNAMNYSGGNATSLLAKQLIASQYNYQNGAYLNGNKTLTMLFVWWGEYIIANPGKYSSGYTLWAKDWFDAYNNSHGGAVAGPR